MLNPKDAPPPQPKARVGRLSTNERRVVLLLTFCYLLAIYAFSAYCGFGVCGLTCPNFLRARLFWLLSPGCGLLLVGIIDGYLIATNRPMTASIPVSLAVGTAVNIAYLIRALTTRTFQDVLPRFATPANPWFLLLALSAGITLTPVLVAGFPTMPYRNGIDQVGYAESAQFLVEGGTLDSARAALLRDLQTTDLEKAKAHNLLALNFSTYVDSEFFIKAFRWGVPGLLATITLLVGATNVYHVEFIALFFNYALTVAIVYAMLREEFGLSINSAIMWSCAFSLNANLLNVYFEGELAETFAQPYLLLLVFLMLRLRKPMSPRDAVRIIAFAAGIIGLLFLAYNELLVLVATLVAGMTIIDIFLERRLRWKPLAAIGAATLAGSLIAAPVSFTWFRYTLKNLAGLSRAGFWQPHWGSLAEISGLFNMYGGAPYELLRRSFLNECAVLIFSGLLAVLIVRLLLKRSDLDRSLWIVAPSIILAVYLKNKYLDGILNYPYMKVYTLLAPLIVVTVAAAVNDFSKSRTFVRMALEPLLIAMTCSAGLVYIGQYQQQSSYVTHDMFALYRFDDGERRLGTVAMESDRYQPRIADYMLTPLLTLHWLNESDTPKLIKGKMGWPLDVVIWKADLYQPARARTILRNRVAYDNGSFLIVKTGRSIADVCPTQAASFTLATLTSNPADGWLATAAQQCNYKIGQRLRQELNDS